MVLGVGLTHQCPAWDSEQPLEIAHQIKRDLTSHFSWHPALLGLDLNQLQNRNRRRLQEPQFLLTSPKSIPIILALHVQFSAECEYSVLQQTLSLPLQEIVGCTEAPMKTQRTPSAKVWPQVLLSLGKLLLGIEKNPGGL